MSSSNDEVIIVDVVEPSGTGSSCTQSGIARNFQNPEQPLRNLSSINNETWTESSDSDDCIIIDDDTDNKVDPMQMKTEYKQVVSATSSPARFTESGVSALRRSARCHQKLNFPASQLSSSAPKKCSEDKAHEPPKKKSKVVATNSYQHMVNTRSVTKRLGSEGCILDPPTPEDELELREWPVEGMHERPVWPDPRYEIPKPPPQPASELEVSLHHSLHAVLAFAAQVGTTVSESEKIMSCMKLALLADKAEQVEDASADFQSFDLYSVPATCANGEGETLHNLMEMLIYTGILYCAVCSVSQKSLANYIDSLSVESALNWFQEVDDTK